MRRLRMLSKAVVNVFRVSYKVVEMVFPAFSLASWLPSIRSVSLIAEALWPFQKVPLKASHHQL